MAEIVTNITSIADYNTWKAALPGVDDGNVHVANWTVAGDYASVPDMDTVVVAFRIQADDTVAYDFSNPAAPHVAFTETTGSAFDIGNSTTAIEIKGIRLQTSDTTATAFACLEANNFIDQNITVRNCRIIGGQNGVRNRNTGSDIYTVINCYFSGQSQAGMWLEASSSSVDHCTVIASNTSSASGLGGIYARTGVTVSNCACKDNGLKDFALTEPTYINCASGDATATGTGAITGITDAAFTNTASDIYTAANGGVLDGAGTGGSDIGIEQGVTNTITITSPTSWTLIQRTIATNTANIAITGTYSGDVIPTAIEASYNGGAFTTIDASPSGGTFSGILTNQPIGNGTLTVRYTNDTGITTTSENVAIGIKCLFWGQSNFVGVATNAQSYLGAAGYFHKYTVTNDVWEEGNDPFTTSTSNGSLFPLLANLLTAGKNIPVGFIGVAQGSTTLSQWQSGQTLNTRMLDYLTNSGGNNIEAIASWIGESDAAAATSEATFKSEYNAVINQLETLTGIKSVLCGIAENGANQDNVRQWIQDIVSTNANALAYVDMYAEFQALHYTTDQEALDAATALYNAMRDSFFSSTLNLSISGIPDGAFMTVLDNEDGTRVFRDNITYASEAASQLLFTDIGTRIKGYVDDGSDPSTNGAYIEGVTV